MSPCFKCRVVELSTESYHLVQKREGFLPLVHTFGVFVTRRPFDQLAMSISAPNLHVILLGFLPGESKA